MDEPKTVERSREEDDAAEDKSEAESTDLPLGKKVNGGNQRLLMLLSSTSGRQEQKTAQDRALTILKGMCIVGSPQLEQLDGADPTHLDRRNALFALSGIRGHYPQFFLVGAGGKVEFFADWEQFEFLNFAGRLAQSLNLAETETYTYPLITPAVIPTQEDTVGCSSTVGDNEFHLMEQQASSLVEHTTDLSMQTLVVTNKTDKQQSKTTSIRIFRDIRNSDDIVTVTTSVNLMFAQLTDCENGHDILKVAYDESVKVPASKNLFVYDNAVRTSINNNEKVMKYKFLQLDPPSCVFKEMTMESIVQGAGTTLEIEVLIVAVAADTIEGGAVLF